MFYIEYYGFLIIVQGFEKSNTFTFKINYATMKNAPIAQGIEHRPPEAGAAVRIRLGVLEKRMKDVGI